LFVLEDGKLQQVGSRKISKVEVRLIAATNKKLKKEIEKGNFRVYVFSGMNVVPLYSRTLQEKKTKRDFILAKLK